jgi:hypothetical protein
MNARADLPVTAGGVRDQSFWTPAASTRNAVCSSSQRQHRTDLAAVGYRGHEFSYRRRDRRPGVNVDTGADDGRKARVDRFDRLGEQVDCVGDVAYL